MKIKTLNNETFCEFQKIRYQSLLTTVGKTNLEEKHKTLYLLTFATLFPGNVLVILITDLYSFS